jgi:hypothetical protein
VGGTHTEYPFSKWIFILIRKFGYGNQFYNNHEWRCQGGHLQVGGACVRRPSGDWMGGHGPQCVVSAIILIGD